MTNNLLSIFVFILVSFKIGNCVTNVKYALTCENNKIDLKCDKNKIIDILEANYGRTTEVTCMQGSVSNVTCYNDNTLAVVSDECEGKQLCTIHASNQVFGDPCHGTYKYLFILYQCLEVTKFKTEFSCERSTAHLKCKPGKLIHILDANYGRKSRLTCSEGTIKTTNCHSRNAVEIVSDMCTNKRSCKVQASNNIFGDPCHGTFKYLSVKYKCVDEPECNGKNSDDLNDIFDNEFNCNNGPTIRNALVCDGIRDCPQGDDELICAYDTKFSCEGHKLEIKCKKNDTIKIVNANYGRLSKNICPRDTNIYDLDCRGPNAYHILQKKCDGKQKCEIKAENKVFRDPCVNTYKYLEAHYICEGSGTHGIQPRSV